MTIRNTLLGLGLAFLSLASLAARTVTDQLNRSVTIPDKIERAVILQHQTLNIATQLDAMPQVVGVLPAGKNSLAATLPALPPAWTNLPPPATSTK